MTSQREVPEWACRAIDYMCYCTLIFLYGLYYCLIIGYYSFNILILSQSKINLLWSYCLTSTFIIHYSYILFYEFRLITKLRISIPYLVCIPLGIYALVSSPSDEDIYYLSMFQLICQCLIMIIIVSFEILFRVWCKEEHKEYKLQIRYKYWSL